MGLGDRSRGGDGAKGCAGDSQSNAQPRTERPSDDEALSRSRRPSLCDACGLPPHSNNDGGGGGGGGEAPLVRCSKCREGWYHDRACQQRHHPLHQKTCRKKIRGRPQSFLVTAPATAPTVVRVAARPPNGNALVLNSLELPHSVAPREASLGLGVFRPVVPPVLTSSCRATHCAWCLAELPPPAETTEISADRSGRRRRRRLMLWEVPNRIEAWACGPQCESAAVGPASGPASLRLQHERDAIMTLHASRHDPPMYLPTALLLFRLLVASCVRLSGPKGGDESRVDWDAHVKVMAERPPSEEYGDSGEEQAHEDAVVRTVQAMGHALLLLHHQQSSARSSPSHTDHARVEPAVLASRLSPDVLRQLLRRVKANAFGIRLCDDDNSPTIGGNQSSHEIGIGIFHVAHFANHSCRPNAEAVYILERGKLPRLSLQSLPASRDRRPPITAHDEITVSYVSNDALALPRNERQRHIFHHFGFRCDCTECRSGA
jgi:hypothetical protein